MAARFESDCLLLLEHLAHNEYVTLKHLVQETGLSKDECRRYLLPEVVERRKLEKVMTWRDKNRKMWKKVIETITVIPDTDPPMCTIDTSKHEYFLKYAEKHGYEVRRVEKYPGVVVRKIQRDCLTDDYYHVKNRYSDDRPDAGTISVTGKEWSPL